MTLDDLLAELRKDEPARTRAAPGAVVDPQALPWWVVVLSKKPKPDGSPRLKFVAGAATKEGAEAERARRQGAEAERVAGLAEEGAAEEGFRFFVIERPKGGSL